MAVLLGVQLTLGVIVIVLGLVRLKAMWLDAPIDPRALASGAGMAFRASGYAGLRNVIASARPAWLGRLLAEPFEADAPETEELLEVVRDELAELRHRAAAGLGALALLGRTASGLGFLAGILHMSRALHPEAEGIDALATGHVTSIATHDAVLAMAVGLATALTALALHRSLARGVRRLRADLDLFGGLLASELGSAASLDS